MPPWTGVDGLRSVPLPSLSVACPVVERTWEDSRVARRHFPKAPMDLRGRAGPGRAIRAKRERRSKQRDAARARASLRGGKTNYGLAP